MGPPTLSFWRSSQSGPSSISASLPSTVFTMKCALFIMNSAASACGRVDVKLEGYGGRG